jgi:hypothetical protein
VAPTLREAEAAGNSSDFDVGEQLLSESAGGDSLPNVPLPDVALLDLPLTHITLTNVRLPNDPLPDVHSPEPCTGGSVGKE